MDTKADRIPKILFSVLLLPLAVLLNELAVTSPTSAAKLTTFEESFSASLPFFRGNARMQVTVIINAAVAHAEILQCWLRREREREKCCKTSVMSTRGKTFQRPPGFFVEKNLVCDGRVRPERERRCLQNLGKASAVTFGVVVEY